MKINELQTRDVCGLSGTRKYVFPDKVTAFMAPNGKGKSSIFNAIRFGLTGASAPNYLHEGAVSADVGLTLDSGTQIIRRLSPNGNAQWLNKRRVELRQLNNALQAEFGLTDKELRVVTASEAIGYIRSQDLGEYMLSFIPETLDLPTVMSYIPGYTKGMADIAAAGLPSGLFGVSAVDQLYADVYAKRRDAKKEKTELSASLRTLGAIPAVTESRKDLEDALAAMQEAIKANAAYEEAMKAFRKASAEIEEKKNRLAKVEAEMKALGTDVFDEATYERLKKEAEDLRAKSEEAKRVSVTLSRTADALRQAIASLEKPVCPLSDKLVCTTDKTPVRKDLVASLKDADDEVSRQNDEIQKLIEALAEKNRAIRAQEAARIAQMKRESFAAQIEGLKAEVSVANPEPEKPTLAYNAAEEKRIRDALIALDTADRRAKIEADLATTTTLVDDLERMVSALSPKGCVKAGITNAYISAFEASCNARADELKKGMRIRFVQQNGIVPMLDVHGDGKYLNYRALSGGERIFMVFLLLDMFNDMCGQRIMFLDELSVLDAENFKILVDVIVNHTKNYDQIFLAGVGHKELVDVLKKHGIAIIDI